jgi:hypothetical protein
MIKALRKLVFGGIYLNIIQALCDKPIANIILHGEKQTISSKIKNKTRVPTISTLIQHSPRIPNQRKKTRRRYKINTNK